MRTFVTLALLLAFGSARAEVPAFTPNIVDPSHRLDAAATQTVSDVLAEMKRQADIRGAVYIADGLEGQSIEALAHEAFDTWKLGEAGKDNGLLLVLAMDEHRMRFEVGYGLEGQLTDLVCQHALDDFVRPQMRAGDVKQALVDGLFAVTRAKRADFHVAADVHYTPPRQRGDFDAPFGGWAWGIYVALLLVGFVGWRAKGWAWGVFVFLVINPGVFVFIGASVLSAHREQHLAELHAFLSVNTADAALAWVGSHLVLVPFYAALSWIAVVSVRRYVSRAVDLETALLDGDPELRALDERYLGLLHGKRLTKTLLPVLSFGAAIGVPSAFLVLGQMLDVSYLHPTTLLAIPAAVFGLGQLAVWLGLRRYASAEAFRAYLEVRVRALTERMEQLVKRGYATLGSDGAFTYTSAYYASQSSSSSGSSFSSSSGGGSSGGGGASSSW